MGIIILGRWWPEGNELGIVLGDILLWVMGLLGDVRIGTPSFKKILEVHSMFTINYLMLYFRGHSKSFKLKYLEERVTSIIELLYIDMIEKGIKR